MNRHEGPPQEVELYDDMLDEDVLPAEEGFADSLTRQFGGAPWWMVSGAFHGLMLLLLTLVGIAIARATTEETVTVIDVKQNKPPEYDKPPINDMVDQKVVFIETDMPPVESPVLHEEVIVDDLVQTDNDMDLQSAKGREDAVSDVPLSGVSSAAAIGMGGPAGGPYGRPLGGGRMRAAKKNGGGPVTEKSVDAALRWLANHQEADGHWDTKKYASQQKTDTACTGFALLAFLGAGHSEKIGPYKDNVKRAVNWLKSKQADNGLVFDTTDAGGHRGVGYPHAIAGMALAEAAGMARQAGTVASAQKAIDYSTTIHQCGEGSELLAWRYTPKSKADLSVSGWYIMQLKSAKVSGLRVDPASFDGAIRFLDMVEQKGDAGDPYSGHRYGYTNNQAINHRRTAIGCLARQFMGWKKDDLQGGVEWFVNNGGVPQWDGNGGSVDLYYWYYGTLCTFQQGGDMWTRWNEAMKKALVENQRNGGDEDGSWDPVGSYSHEWGRVGQTALACLCLEVYYRYLPMYK